jgi:polysaccharide pyruvyl transferase WcaK-like protein
MKVLLLHAYSAANAGDGLLVEESVGILREAFGQKTEITVCARYPDSFADLDVHVVGARVFRGRTFNWQYFRLLRRADCYDLIVGVGGGYLRFGTPVEALKTAIAHVPQLLAAACSSTPAVYLPQSIGPVRYFPRTPLRRLLARIETLFLRDNRSISEVALTNAIRVPDLAIVGSHLDRPTERAHETTPVLTVRSIRGRLPEQVLRLARELDEFDGYVQSRVGANNDEDAVRQTHPARLLTEEELMSPVVNRRVVIAVRLHAALMALNAGHWVIHLAYERKGFGAFADLGLDEYVHNIYHFNVDTVLEQVRSLLNDEERRREYDRVADGSHIERASARRRIVSALQAAVG